MEGERRDTILDCREAELDIGAGNAVCSGAPEMEPASPHPSSPA